MVNRFAFAREPTRSIGHDTLALRFPDFLAQIRFWTFTEFARTTLRNVQWNDVIANRKFIDILADALDNAATFMAQNNGENAFGIETAQCVCVGVANTGCQYLDAHFVRFRRCDFYIFDGQWLTWCPCDRCFAFNNLKNSIDSY